MKKLLFIVLFILFSTNVSADFNSSMRAWWNFTKDGVDSIGGFTMTATNVVFVDGKADFEAGNSSKLERADQLLSQDFDGAATDNFTVCFSNITIESLVDGGGLWGENDGNLEAFILRTKNNAGTYQMNTWDTTIWCSTALSVGLTYSFCMTYDETLSDVYFYQSNSSSCGSNTNWNIGISTVAKSNIGSYAGGGGNFDGTINEVCAWDRVINTSEIDEFMTYGCAGEPPAAAPPAPPAGGNNNTFTPAFYLTTNLTGGTNITDNPISVKVNGTINYTYSGFLDNNKLIGYYQFNDATALGNDTTVNQNHGNMSNSGGTGNGNEGTALYFNGSTYVTLPNSNTLLDHATSDVWSIMAWFNATSIYKNGVTDCGNRIITMTRTTPATTASICLGSGMAQVWWYDGSANQLRNLTSISTNVWHHLALTYDGTTFNAYVDGVNQLSEADSFGVFNAVNAYIGTGASPGNQNFTGYIDEVRLYNYTLTGSQISSIYNSTYPQFTCTVYINGTETNTSSGLNISTQYNYLGFSTTGFEGSKSVNLTCTDQFLSDSDQVNIWYDVVTPVITVTDTLSNNSVLTRHIDSLSFNVSCSDTYLYGCGYQIFRLNPDKSINTTLNGTHTSNIPDSSFKYNFTGNMSFNFTHFNTSVWPDGLYKVTFSANDSHTVIFIPDYEWSTYQVVVNDKTYKGIEFNNNVFNISTDDYARVNTFALVKDNDRYLMYFNLEGVGTPFDLFLASKKDMIYLPNSPNQGHFLVGKHWIDFESDDVTDFSVTYIPTYGVYRVRFTPLKKNIIFRSIGDMNIVTQDYYFNISSGFTFYAQDGITTDKILNFTVNVLNGSTVVQSKHTSGYNLTFNITEGNYSTNITAGGYATNRTGNLTFTNGGSFTYSLYAANSLYLFFYDESTDAEINSTNITVQVLGPSSANEYNTGTGTLFISGFSTGEYEIRYGASGYRTNAYFTTISTSSTQSIDLYMIQNTSSSLIVFEISDEKGFPISNVTLKAQRFFINDNAYLVVSMAKTDSNGETALYMEPNDVFYKFIVQNSQGTVLFTGSPQKIFSSTQLLKINLLEDVLYSLGVIRDSVTTNLSWNNNTNIVSYFFNDASGVVMRGCVEVVGRDTFSETLYGPSCVDSSSATILLNMTGNLKNNTVYLGRGYVITNTTSSDYFTDLIEFTLTKNFQRFGNLGLFLGYIFIATMFFLGLPFNFSVALVYGIVSMIAMQLLGLTWFGWSFIAAVSIIGFVIAVVNKI